MKKKEKRFDWEDIVQTIDKDKYKIKLGKYIAYWMYKSPRRLLHYFSYYKFASKIIGKRKKVLDVGCSEGLGTYLIAKECGFAKGVDFDKEAIELASSNFSNFNNVKFECKDVFEYKDSNKWDALISFDVVEHIFPSNSDSFFSMLSSLISSKGIVIIGTPSKISQNYASKISKKGHVNIFTYQKLKNKMKQFFDLVFMFSVNDEVIHTGFHELAHYFIVIGCKKKI